MIPQISGTSVYRTTTTDICNQPLEIGDLILVPTTTSYMLKAMYIGSSSSGLTDYYTYNTKINNLQQKLCYLSSYRNVCILKYDWSNVKLTKHEEDFLYFSLKNVSIMKDFIEYAWSLKTKKKYTLTEYLNYKGITDLYEYN